MTESRGKTVNKFSIKLVQVSDAHLFAETDGKLLGLNTDDSLQSVLDLIKKEQPDLDMVLVTGDISQDESEASYQRFERHMNTLIKPSYWLQGNHDNSASILQALGGNERLSPCVVSAGSWRIIMLNSSVKDQVGGYLPDSELKFLEQSLADNKDKHVMVALHHQPVKVGSAWLDEQMVSNAEQFLSIIHRHKQVKALLWGHVHQAVDAQLESVRLLSLPSTCIQFKPGEEHFVADHVNPGYRWFELYDDGSFDTDISRVEDREFNVDYSTKGY